MPSNNIVTINNLLPSQATTLPALGKTYIGIDFGTSTTVVSIAVYDWNARNVKVQTVPIEQTLEDGGVTNSKLVPSVIALNGSQLLIGEGASYLKYLLQRDEAVWYSFKMQLGEDYHYYASLLKNQGIFSIETPQDATAVFFMYLKSKIEKYCQNKGFSSDIQYAVSIPASFEANQRQDLIEALHRNNIMVNRQSLIDEPNAAFLSYIQESAIATDDAHKIVVQNDYNPKVLVFDFGGGTCDISILEIGKGLNGYYSKNLSISKFTQLGGDDIDRYIAWNYLLPYLVKGNGKTLDDFRIPDKKYIVNHLMKIAEQLKINLCSSISVMMNGYKLPAIINSEDRKTVYIDTDIDTKKGHLHAQQFSLSFKEFTEVMAVFTNLHGNKVTQKKHQKDYNSIFNPIESALHKAHLNKDEELDYVLFIGGSSKNPYVQHALSEYFADSELLIPNNLQTHVSKGAAIHSLVINGFGKNIIRPITSEPIIVITKNNSQRTLIPAGVEIPYAKVTIDDLAVSRDGQQIVELPICVGNRDKMLFNIRISLPRDLNVKKGDQVALSVEYTADKLLKTEAYCHGIHIVPEQMNPFANKELTSEERAVIKAEREVAQSEAMNNGIPSRQALSNLIAAYKVSNNAFQAAETAESKEEYYPGSEGYNEIGILYSNSGNRDKAIRAYEKAIEKDPRNSTLYGNLAMEYEFSDKQKYKDLVRKAYELDSHNPVRIIQMARAEAMDGNLTESKRLKDKAYQIYEDMFNSGRLRSWDYSWFSSLARDLGHYDMASKIMDAEPKVIQKNNFFNEQNLASMKDNNPVKI